MTKELMASEPLTLDGTELTSNTPSEPGKRWGCAVASPQACPAWPSGWTTPSGRPRSKGSGSWRW